LDSRTRLITAIKVGKPDHIPLYCWVFGFRPPEYLRWTQDGNEVNHWYTMRLEHIHTLPESWDIYQDFRRVEKFLSIELDDVLDVSVPWSVHPDVKIHDWLKPENSRRPQSLLCREYQTPVGILKHIVRKTGEFQGPGWVIQADHVPLFEDFNIPRGVKHAISRADDIDKLIYLLCPPTDDQMKKFNEQMERIKAFAKKRSVMVQAWSAFGMDGVVWLCGAEEAVIMAMEEPSQFRTLADIMFEFDKMRTEIMLSVGGVDMIVQRGWYSSTDFWSPRLFRKFVLPYLKELSEIAHRAGVLFAYVMTTGLMGMIDELKEANIDLLYFVDPVQDRIDMKEFKTRVDGSFAIAGGINSGVTLGSGTQDEISKAVYSAMETFGKDRGFILSPVDALFPDTPIESFETMVKEWRKLIPFPC